MKTLIRPLLLIGDKPFLLAGQLFLYGCLSPAWRSFQHRVRACHPPGMAVHHHTLPFTAFPYIHIISVTVPRAVRRVRPFQLRKTVPWLRTARAQEYCRQCCSYNSNSVNHVSALQMDCSINRRSIINGKSFVKGADIFPLNTGRIYCSDRPQPPVSRCR